MARLKIGQILNWISAPGINGWLDVHISLPSCGDFWLAEINGDQLCPLSGDPDNKPIIICDINYCENYYLVDNSNYYVVTDNIFMIGDSYLKLKIVSFCDSKIKQKLKRLLTKWLDL